MKKCYLIEDSVRKIGNIRATFRNELSKLLELKLVNDQGTATDELPLRDMEYHADDVFLFALTKLPEVKDSIFLIDLALNKAEARLVQKLETQKNGGVFEAVTAAKIVKKLLEINPEMKIMITSYIGVDGDSWKNMLLDLPEDDPIEEGDLEGTTKRAFIYSKNFSDSNPDVRKHFQPFL